MCYLLDSGPLSVVVALRENGSARDVGSVLGKAGGNWSGLIGFRGERPDLLIAAQRLMARNAAAVTMFPAFDGQPPDKSSNRCAAPFAVAPRGPDEPGARGGSALRVSLQVPLWIISGVGGRATLR